MDLTREEYLSVCGEIYDKHAKENVNIKGMSVSLVSDDLDETDGKATNVITSLHGSHSPKTMRRIAKCFKKWSRKAKKDEPEKKTAEFKSVGELLNFLKNIKGVELVTLAEIQARKKDDPLAEKETESPKSEAGI